MRRGSLGSESLGYSGHVLPRVLPHPVEKVAKLVVGRPKGRKFGGSRPAVSGITHF